MEEAFFVWTVIGYPLIVNRGCESAMDSTYPAP